MRYIVLFGLQGSGKSTFTQKILAKAPGSAVVSRDNFRIQEDGTYLFDPAKEDDVHRRYFSTLRGYATGQYTVQNGIVIVDDANLQELQILQLILTIDNPDNEIYFIIFEKHHPLIHTRRMIQNGHVIDGEKFDKFVKMYDETRKVIEQTFVRITVSHPLLDPFLEDCGLLSDEAYANYNIACKPYLDKAADALCKYMSMRIGTYCIFPSCTPGFPRAQILKYLVPMMEEPVFSPPPYQAPPTLTAANLNYVAPTFNACTNGLSIDDFGIYPTSQFQQQSQQQQPQQQKKKQQHSRSRKKNSPNLNKVRVIQVIQEEEKKEEKREEEKEKTPETEENNNNNNDEN